MSSQSKFDEIRKSNQAAVMRLAESKYSSSDEDDDDDDDDESEGRLGKRGKIVESTFTTYTNQTGANSIHMSIGMNMYRGGVKKHCKA